MVKNLLFILLLLTIQVVNAQDFQKRYAFAKSYFGIDMNYVPSYGDSYYLNTDNKNVAFNRNGFITPAINLAASHFWGYTDIYVTINTVNFKTQKDRIGNTTSLGAASGFRIYPLPLKDNMLRPFVGYKFSPLTYTQRQLNNELHTHSATKSMLDIGIGYRKPRLYVYAAYNRVLNPEFETYVSRTQKQKTQFPTQFFNVGINLAVETTRSSDNKKSKQVHALLDTTNQAGFFFGIGPSSVFPLVRSAYIQEDRPFLNDKSIVGILPDLALGYHFTKQDFVVAAAFRPITQKRNAFSFEQTISRNSLVVETYKFLLDYHGFAPFLGGGASFENINVLEKDNGKTITDFKENKLTPIISFGWDIRPSRKSDVWLLRTNLRYAPLLETEINGKSLNLKHLEFNYIQFVIYPNRRKLYRSK